MSLADVKDAIAELKARNAELETKPERLRAGNTSHASEEYSAESEASPMSNPVSGYEDHAAPTTHYSNAT